jgi:hypothetical protein
LIYTASFRTPTLFINTNCQWHPFWIAPAETQ